MAIITLKVDNEVIASRIFKDYNLNIPGYVEGLKKDIIEEHEEVIYLSNRKPQFEVIPIPNSNPCKE